MRMRLAPTLLLLSLLIGLRPLITTIAKLRATMLLATSVALAALILLVVIL